MSSSTHYFHVVAELIDTNILIKQDRKAKQQKRDNYESCLGHNYFILASKQTAVSSCSSQSNHIELEKNISLRMLWKYDLELLKSNGE